MYTNIDTTHALTEIESFFASESFLELRCDCDIDATAVLDAIRINMRHSVFPFNFEYWRTGRPLERTGLERARQPSRVTTMEGQERQSLAEPASTQQPEQSHNFVRNSSVSL
jgi:hypothetical protein